jgi:hypothetical protein
MGWINLRKRGENPLFAEKKEGIEVEVLVLIPFG